MMPKIKRISLAPPSLSGFLECSKRRAEMVIRGEGIGNMGRLFLFVNPRFHPQSDYAEITFSKILY